MKTSIAIVLATTLLACGGSVAPGKSVAFDVSSNAVTFPAPPQSVSIDIFTDAAGTVPYSTPTINVPNCTSTIKTACWDTLLSKFNTYGIDLPGSATPGTDYWLTVKFWSAAGQTGTVVALIPLKNIKVISGKVNAFTISQANVEAPAAPGVIVNSFPAAATVVFGGTKALTPVSATDPSATPGTLSFAWALGTGSSNPGCTGSSLSAANVASPTFTAGTTAGACKLTLTVSTTSAGVPSASQAVTLTVSPDSTISVTGVPPPLITSVGIASNNAADVACSIVKPGAGWSGANTTCPKAFALAQSPLNPADRFASQGYFGDISVQYDVQGAGLNPNALPTVGATVFCTNDAVEYGTDPTKPKSVSFAPGYLVGGTVLASDSFWAEPDFSVTLPNLWDATQAYAVGDKVLYNGVRYAAILANTDVMPDDPAAGAATWGSPVAWVAADYTKNWTAASLCTFTVKVTNEGGSDSLNFYAYFQ